MSGSPVDQNAGGATRQSDADPIPVTADNFTRAETDMYFGMLVKRGGLGRFDSLRELHSIEGAGVRPNRDTLYSEAVFDLDAGPVEVTLPDAGDRYLAMMVMDEDHYVPTVVYGAGTHTYNREQIGTRYLFLAVRILVNPNDPRDVAAVHELQDAITARQPGGPGEFVVPNWERQRQKTVRDALLALSSTLPDLRRAGGARTEVDPVRHLIATASGWGLNPDKDAIYLNVTPSQNDGATVHRLTVPNAIPVDGFWSISVYDAEGHFVRNAHEAYTVNNVTAIPNAEGSVTVQFGGCDGQVENCLPIFPNWNYMVRLYRPRSEILAGSWEFPDARPVEAT